MTTERIYVIDDQNQIRASADGGTIFIGRKAVDRYTMIALKSALKGYHLFKMKPNRAWTPANMLAKATEFTGIKYKRGEYMKAHDDLKGVLDHLKSVEVAAMAESTAG